MPNAPCVTVLLAALPPLGPLSCALGSGTKAVFGQGQRQGPTAQVVSCSYHRQSRCQPGPYLTKALAAPTLSLLRAARAWLSCGNVQ